MKAFKSQEGKESVLSFYGTLLENLTVPHDGQTLRTRFGDTFILTAGDAANPPMIMLHGSSMNSAMWIGDINALAGSYRIYAPDIPGEPGKSDEEQLPFDTSDYADWLLDVMDALSLDSAILVGASLGAFIAVKFAVSHPERVAKLILLCPAGIGSQNHAFRDIAMSLLSKGEAGVDELFTIINGGEPIPPAIMGYQKLIAMSFNSRQELIPSFTDDELKRLTMPCKVFAGAKDIMLRSDETRERISRLLPGADVVMLPDKGHSLSGLADDMADFLRQT